MKVIMVANISANGKVLLAENQSHQVPQEATGIFIQKAREAGNLIIGKKTFELFQQFMGDPNGAFSGIEIVILSTRETLINDYKVVSSPDAAINYLSAKGYKEVVVGGGTKTYNAFLDKDLVTDIFCNLHPLITGNGGSLVTNNELTSRFKIRDQKQADNYLQLHLVRE